MLRIDRWKVQQLMKRKGIKEFRELAERVGVAPQTVSGWFRGLGFTSETLEALCNVLDCLPNDVLTLDPKPVAPLAALEIA